MNEEFLNDWKEKCREYRETLERVNGELYNLDNTVSEMNGLIFYNIDDEDNTTKKSNYSPAIQETLDNLGEKLATLDESIEELEKAMEDGYKYVYLSGYLKGTFALKVKPESWKTSNDIIEDPKLERRFLKYSLQDEDDIVCSSLIDTNCRIYSNLYRIDLVIDMLRSGRLRINKEINKFCHIIYSFITKAE